MPTFMQNANRIVGGEAAPEMIPWQVAMLTGNFLCGGTVLDSCTILTAAHCRIITGNTSIRAGSTNLRSGGQV